MRLSNYSIKKRRPVAEIIGQSFPASLVLGIAALGFAICLGLPLGVISAVRKNTWVDYSGMAIAMVGICVPAFVIGPLLQIGIATRIPILKVAGWDAPVDIILPAFTLGLVTAAYLARLTRGGMLEILSQDYIRTARAKGVPLPPHHPPHPARRPHPGRRLHRPRLRRPHLRLLHRRNHLPGPRHGPALRQRHH